MSAGTNQVSEIGAGEIKAAEAKVVVKDRPAATGAGTAPRLSENRGAG